MAQTESERLIDQGHEDIILYDSVKESKYSEPWIKEYVIEQRNKKKTWEEIADGLKERGLDNITAQKCSSLHKEAIARTLTTSTEAKEDFMEFTSQIKQIYGDSIKLMGDYVKTLRIINEELTKVIVYDEEGKVNLLATQMTIAKQIPIATGLMKVVRDYTETQKEFFDKIETTKEEDVVWNESKMISYMNEAYPIVIKEKIKQIRQEYGDNVPLSKVEKYMIESFN